VASAQDSLTYLLQKAAKHALVALEAELTDLDISARHFLLLALVEQDPAVSQQDLAGKIGLDPTSVVKLVDQLEDRGFVTRARFADDRRQHRLALTAAGKQMLKEAVARQRKAEREVTKAIGARRDDLTALLAAMVFPAG
jgi:DNA-binding MarR family transcriptional regulator